MAERSARESVRDLALVLGAAVSVAIAVALLPGLLRGDGAFDAAAPPDELRLCRDYGRTAIHASPLPGAPVVDPVSPAFQVIARSAIGETGCPFVFEVRLAEDRYVQYTGRGGP